MGGTQRGLAVHFDPLKPWVVTNEVDIDVDHGHNPLFGEGGPRGLTERPFKPRRRLYHRKGPREPDRKPIENDSASKACIAKLNRPEKPLS